MATWFTDVATNQQQGVNFPGFPGLQELTNQPGSQNNPLFEGPDEVVASYTWTGNEAANDIINICIAPAGTVISPNGHVSSGLTAITSTLTLAIGDNDLAIASLLPIPNAAAVQQNSSPTTAGQTAPNWVSATTYVYGNVVTDPNSTPANLTYTMVAASNSGTTAPHSASNTVWMPNNQRYSNSIDTHAATGNVAFAGGTQLYGGPASIVPASITPGTLPTGLTGAQTLNQPYVIQYDCWIQALILTLNTTNINANAVSVFRVGMSASN